MRRRSLSSPEIPQYLGLAAASVIIGISL